MGVSSSQYSLVSAKGGRHIGSYIYQGALVGMWGACEAVLNTPRAPLYIAEVSVLETGNGMLSYRLANATVAPLIS